MKAQPKKNKGGNKDLYTNAEHAGAEQKMLHRDSFHSIYMTGGVFISSKLKPPTKQFPSHSTPPQQESEPARHVHNHPH
jgi:hypothetical protein